MLIAVERRIADSTEADAAANHLLLARNVQQALHGTGSDNHSRRRKLRTAFAAHTSLHTVNLQRCNLLIKIGRTQRHRLLINIVGQLGAVDVLDTGPVFNLKGFYQLAAGSEGFQHQSLQASAARINSCRQTGSTAADNNQVIAFIGSLLHRRFVAQKLFQSCLQAFLRQKACVTRSNLAVFDKEQTGNNGYIHFLRQLRLLIYINLHDVYTLAHLLSNILQHIAEHLTWTAPGRIKICQKRFLLGQHLLELCSRRVYNNRHLHQASFAMKFS